MAKVTLLEKKGCTSCTRARDWLAEHDIDFESREFFRQRLSAEELNDLLVLTTPGELFAWRSPRAKARGLTEGEVADEALVHLMLEEPYLIRRPTVLTGDRLIVGANDKKLAEAFGS
ncbi:MAG: hypothetical protein GEU28_05060 [Dehalococcoidia bacterium]|nr:hypothetical protein [Dehalococcoidia bacterium]